MDLRPARRCSSCGQQGHNARTCLDKDERGRPREHTVGVTTNHDSFEEACTREVVQSPTAVSPFSDTPAGSASGSGSDTQQGTTPSPHFTRERRRGTPWTEEEHRAFLAGLDKLGKGDWRGISKDFVTSRTPTQVASHAQKYFIRHNNQSKRKRRTSLFDLKADSEAAGAMRSRGSAEATSATWPQAQHSSSGHPTHRHAWNAPSPSQHLSAGVSQPAAHRDVHPYFGQAYYPPPGVDMNLLQHYMQMTGLPLETVMLQMMTYQAAHGAAMPSFPAFNAPSLADQLMAAYAVQAASHFPPNAFPPTEAQAPMALPGLLPHQAAAALAFLNHQQHHQHQQQQEVSAQSQQQQQQQQQDSAGKQSPQLQSQPGNVVQHAQQADDSSRSSHQPDGQSGSPQSETIGQHHVGNVTGNGYTLVGQLPFEGQSLSAKDPAFGHGRLYRPQASHAKAVAAPAAMRFGNFEDGISRRSSSESVVPANAQAGVRNSSPVKSGKDVLLPAT